MFVWGAAQRDIPPQINVIGTAMFLISVSIVVMAETTRRSGVKAST